MLYTIEDKTLTAMGNAIRNKRNGTSELPMLNVENVSIGYNITYPYELPDYVKKVQINGFVKFLNGEGTFTPYKAYGSQGLGVAPGSFGRYDNEEVKADENYNIVWNGYSAGEKDVPKIVDFETEIEGNKWAFIATRYDGSPQQFDIYFTAIGLDENGNEFKYTPLEMIEKINEMDIIPPSVFNITGDCSYRFANGGWDWLIEQYGDKITTSNITNLENMFYEIDEITSIPFDINAKIGTNVSCANMFSGSGGITNIPKVNNVKPTETNNLFYGCAKLREIPKDWCDTWDWSYLNGLTSTYGGSMGSMFSYCYSLRKYPNSLLSNGNPVKSYSSNVYYELFRDCHTLDEVIDLPFPHYNASWTSNGFSNTFGTCCRLKNMTFALQEDGSPYVMKWKKQTIDLGTCGYTTYKTYITDYGITADKEVKDDATYQALKNDPDWFTCDINYSRYNHDSAVATINSLPDCSATGTNTIKFKGASGALTDGGAINTLTEEEIAVATAKGWTVSLS